MRDLVDARNPDADVALRGVLRYSYERERLESSVATRTTEKQYMEVVLGGSFIGIFDFGLRSKPIEYVTRDGATKDGSGGLDLGAKVAWSGDLGGLGAYVTQQLATGSRSLEHTYETEAGGAATLAVLGQQLSFHTNLAFVDQNSGRLGFRYRFYVGVVPWADEDVVLRLWVGMNGLEHEGTPGSEIELAGGVQTRFANLVSVDLTLTGRVYDGALPPHVHDAGTFGVHVGAGVGFTF
jgi:hypothetical protein